MSAEQIFSVSFFKCYDIISLLPILATGTKKKHISQDEKNMENGWGYNNHHKKMTAYLLSAHSPDAPSTKVLSSFSLLHLWWNASLYIFCASKKIECVLSSPGTVQRVVRNIVLLDLALLHAKFHVILWIGHGQFFYVTNFFTDCLFGTMTCSSASFSELFTQKKFTVTAPQLWCLDTKTILKLWL